MVNEYIFYNSNYIAKLVLFIFPLLLLILQLACSEQTCHWEPENLVRVRAKSLQFCSTLCDPMDYSPPSSTVHSIFQTRILKWAAIPFSRGSSWLRYWTCVSWGSCTVGGFFPVEPPGKPENLVKISEKLLLIALGVSESRFTSVAKIPCRRKTWSD